MKAKENPFKPTAGGEPPLLIGRGKVIRDFEKDLDNGVGAQGALCSSPALVEPEKP